MILTWRHIKDRLALSMRMCNDNPELLRLANEAEERLLNRPLPPVGSVVRYRFCARESCLVLPRQVRTVEGISVCDVPRSVRPDWFEFLASGPGRLRPEDCAPVGVDHGFAVAFDEVLGEDRRIRVYTDSALDEGKRIILRYYRGDSGEKLFTEYGGVVQEGEEITLLAPPLYAKTTMTVRPGGLYAVIKDPTQYPVRLFECDVNGNNTKALAWYEPSETHPQYRKLFLPGLGGEVRTVDALVRLQHIPFALDNDLLVIGNVAALKLMMISIQREETLTQVVQAANYALLAQRELDGELAAHQGSGVTISIDAEPSFGAGNCVPCLL